MEGKQGESYTKENDGQLEEKRKMKEAFTSGGYLTNSLELIPEQSSEIYNLETDSSQKDRDREVVLKVSLESENLPKNKDQVVERMNSNETERIPGRKARNTSMNKSVKGNYHVAIQRDRLDSYRFYKNRYDNNKSNAEEVRRHSDSISDNNYPAKIPITRTNTNTTNNSDQSTRHSTLAEMNSGSFDDDVFVANPSFSRLESNTSTTSTTTIRDNPYNNLNYRIHDALWCPCILPFFYLCCSPSIYFMTNSDSFFRQNDDKKAKLYARTATGLYLVGTIFALLFYTGIFVLLLTYVLPK